MNGNNCNAEACALPAMARDGQIQQEQGNAQEGTAYGSLHALCLVARLHHIARDPATLAIGWGWRPTTASAHRSWTATGTANVGADLAKALMGAVAGAVGAGGSALTAILNGVTSTVGGAAVLKGSVQHLVQAMAGLSLQGGGAGCFGRFAT